jgi:lipid A ethanolaminephosphotransferase
MTINPTGWSARLGRWSPSGIAGFILFCAVANAALFQWPLYRLAVNSRSALEGHDVLALLTLFVVQLLVSITILGLVALLSIRLLKLLCMLFAVGNAVALYFIVQYGVLIDASMSGNILNTRFGEAAELAHPKLLLYTLFLGVVPALLVARVRIKASSRARRGAFVLVSLMLGSAWLYANASSWLWIDKHGKQFGGLMLPWSYVINPLRYHLQESRQSRAPDLLPPLTSTDPQRVVVVLVIGESARAQNFSLFGYGRETNPLLARSGAIAFPGATACATYTTAALRCMLSHRSRNAQGGNDEPLPSYLHRHGVEVIWRTNNFGEPPLQVSHFERADEIRKKCLGDCARLDYDEVLLDGLAGRLRDAPDATKTLVVLHQTGSHGPQYFKKYPPEFERFKPTCRTVELQKCSAEELVNAYDNTIVYTDQVLHRVIELLKSLQGTASVMLYMSDHGESLGENGLYLHGVPSAIAPEVQTAVPLLAWMSDDFLRLRGSTRAASLAVSSAASSAAANAGGPLSHDVVFHSVMGALGLTSAIYAPQRDLFSTVRPVVAGSQAAVHP